LRGDDGGEEFGNRGPHRGKICPARTVPVRRPRAGAASLRTWRHTHFINRATSSAAVDAMVTNFHLPESTLLMLCSAFAGREALLAAYAHAVQARYRFFSYVTDVSDTLRIGAAARMSAFSRAGRARTDGFELFAQDGQRGAAWPNSQGAATVETPGSCRRHLRYGQGNDAGGLEQIGAHRARQHLSPVSAAGLDVIAHQDCHRFMHWRRRSSPIRAAFRFGAWRDAEISGRAARFRSAVDGAKFSSRRRNPCDSGTLALGCGDELRRCTPYPATESCARGSMELSMRWAVRGFHE